MVTPVDSSTSGLTQLFFENRFPEPKDDELLLKAKKAGKSGDGSEDSAQPQDGVNQAGFSQALQSVFNADAKPAKGREEEGEQVRRDPTLQNSSDGQGADAAYDRLKVTASYNALFWA